ncbi:hypothetical protein JYQ79_15600, partial [Anaerobutyricum hallii]|uniref:hypothetical protein n=1 Tax=Anaerobutyricum hallii TaxID=39488 RepID=UPI001ADD6253
YFFFWRNLIHKKCPLSDKRFYFFNCLPKREHTNLASGVRLPCSLTNQNLFGSVSFACGKSEFFRKSL